MKKAPRHLFMNTTIRPLAAACWLTCSLTCAAQESAPAIPAEAVSGEECELTITAAPLPFRQFDKVEIAGTAITDPQSKLAQPVQVICRRQVERSPATYPVELLQQLPALMQHQNGTLSGSSDLIAVHGNPAGTLVLLNGQRLPRSRYTGWLGSGDAVDLRFLPMSAIDRVEVQTPGSSSAMGSDGIAGIVNILTRKSRGLALGGEILSPTRGQGHGQGVHVSWGQGSLRTEGYTLQIHAALNQRNLLMVSPHQPTARETPPSTRSQWFMEGEWAIGSQWTGFGHLLGTHETPPNITTDGTQAWLADASIARTPVLLAQTDPQSMQQWRVGLKGPWQQWDVLASASSGQARQQHTLVTLPERWDPLAALPILAEQRHQTRLQTLNVQAQRELDSPPQGPRTLSLGWQWLQESLATHTSTSGAGDWQGQRQQWAVHAEFKTPLAERHKWTASLRHDHLSDLGGTPTAQMGWKWRPATDFLMRASLGTGLRAPGLDQLSPQITHNWLMWDPIRQTTLRIQRRGQANLKAEQSTHTSWGFRLEPHPRWTLGADLWHLDVRQTIGYPDPAIQQAAGLMRSDAQGPYLDAVATNLGRSRKQGIDYDTEWRVPGDAGLIRLSVKGVLYLKSMLKEAASGQTVSDLAYFSGITQTVTPRHEVTLGASLERANWIVMSHLRYRSAYREALGWPVLVGTADEHLAGHMPSHWRWDLGAQWALNRQWSVSAWLQDATDRGRTPTLTSASVLQTTEGQSLENMGRSIKLKALYRL